jgi:hypothetical protein
MSSAADRHSGLALLVLPVPAKHSFSIKNILRDRQTTGLDLLRQELVRVATGFLIDPIAFVRSLVDDFALVAATIGALIVGKGIAAAIAARTFKYSTGARMTMWALTLPQVAATLAAALVTFDTFNLAGQRLLDGRMLNVVFVLILSTSILPPVLTERFAPRLRTDAAERKVASGRWERKELFAADLSCCGTAKSGILMLGFELNLFSQAKHFGTAQVVGLIETFLRGSTRHCVRPEKEKAKCRH